MKTNLTGHHVDITMSMRQYVDTKFTRLNRHFDNVIKSHVILTVERQRHKAEASLHIRGNQLYAEATADDMYAAIDALANKLDRQVIKHKEKTKDHHRLEGSHRNLYSMMAEEN